MDRIRGDAAFGCIHDKLDSMINPINFVGRAPEQVEEFILDEIDPILEANSDILNVVSADSVNV
jgi:adenylosuccinate lyase